MLSSHPRPLLFSRVCTIFHVLLSVLRWFSTCFGEQSIPNCSLMAFKTRLNEITLNWLVDLFPYFTSSAKISNIKYSIGFDHLNCFSPFLPIIYCYRKHSNIRKTPPLSKLRLLFKNLIQTTTLKLEINFFHARKVISQYRQSLI